MKYGEDAYTAVSGKTVDAVNEEHLHDGRTRLVFTFADGAELEITTRATSRGRLLPPEVEHYPIRFTPPEHSRR